MAGRMIHEMGQEADKSQKTRYAWDPPFISQAISVKMSSNVDDERLILRTNGVRKTRQAGYIQGDLSMQGLRHGFFCRLEHFSACS
jgi:hypothetical protein